MSTLQRSVLIIGGNGYIGSAVRMHLQARGHVVDSVDLCLYGENVTNSRILDFCQMSAEDLSCYDVIVLLAGNSSVQSCLGDPLHSLDNNVRNFVEILGKIQDQKFIYANSASVYGISRSIPTKEKNFEFKPIGAYDVSKMVLDYYAPISRAEYYGLRFGSVNGWHRSPTIRGDIVVNSMVKAALTGQDIACLNPQLGRAILGLRDLCRAIEIVINCPEDLRGIYNLSSFNATIGDIASAVQHKTGASIRTQFDPQKIMYDFRCDTSLFEKTFSFVFEDNLDSIIASLMDKFESLDFTYRTEILPYVHPA